MKSRAWIRLGLVLPASLLFASCASTKISNIEKGKELKLYDDEVGIWKNSEEMQKSLLKSNFIYKDEALSAYVNNILHKLVQDSVDDKVTLRAYIVGDPNFNASIAPTGAIFVHTGLLANLDNEAQLATILGHEATHFLHRHALKSQRSAINATAFFSFVQISAVAGAGALAYNGYDPRGADLISQYIGLGVVGSIYGYSRDLEKEADETGFQLLEKAGYDPKESKRAFENLYEATKDEEKLAPYFFQTHPRVKERIRNFDNYLKNLSKEKNMDIAGMQNADEFIHMTKDVLLFNAELDLKRNRPKLAQKQLEKFDKYFPDNYMAHFLFGKLFNMEKETVKAQEELEKSISLNPDFADSRKELGLLYWKGNEKENARVQFGKYLSLRPEAQDASYIKGYMNE